MRRSLWAIIENHERCFLQRIYKELTDFIFMWPKDLEFAIKQTCCVFVFLFFVILSLPSPHLLFKNIKLIFVICFIIYIFKITCILNGLSAITGSRSVCKILDLKLFFLYHSFFFIPALFKTEMFTVSCIMCDFAF